MTSSRSKMPVDKKSKKQLTEKSGQTVDKKGKLDLNEIKLEITQNQLETMVKKMIDQATLPLFEEIELLKSELDELRKSQEFVSSSHDSLNCDFKKLLNNDNTYKKEIEILNKNASNLNMRSLEDSLKMDDLEQYNRRLNLQFEGVPQKKDENVKKIVLDLVKKLDVDISESQISIAHRLPIKHVQNVAKPSAHPSIIARFTNADIRNEIYSKRRKVRDFSSFPIPEMTSLFINENLTQSKKKLFWLTKQKAKELNFKFIWTNNGRIFVRKNEESLKKQVRIESDLDKLLQI